MIAVGDLPKKLEGWTYDTVVALVKKYHDEPSVFDFKEVLNATNQGKSEHAASIRRTACSMANADGGYILFGVLDREKPAATIEQRIPGILLENNLRKKFQEKIAKLQRPVYFDTNPSPIPLPTNSTRGILVVYIPQSPLRPHCDPTTGVFYRRADGGNADHMDFYEVREQMMYTEERLRKVTLFRLELAQYQKMILMLQNLGDNIVKSLLRFDTGAFKIMLADICGFIPPQSNLLSYLLEIPMYANLINEFLVLTSTPTNLRYVNDDGTPKDPNIERKVAILGNLVTLKELCDRCEQALDELFSSLEKELPR